MQSGHALQGLFTAQPHSHAPRVAHCTRIDCTVPGKDGVSAPGRNTKPRPSGQQSRAGSRLSAVASPPTELRAIRQKDHADRPAPSGPVSTSVWPCRGGQMVRVLQHASADSHVIQVILEGVEPGHTAELLWGVYRSSPHAWQHPEAVVPPDSRVDGASGAMLSPMQPFGGNSASITLTVPSSLAPLTLAFVVSLEPAQDTDAPHKKRKFAAPLQGRHFSTLIGLQAGTASPLGPSRAAAAPAPAGKPKKKKPAGDTEAATVNFAVRCRGGSSVALVVMRPPPADGSSSNWTSVELALDPVLNRTGDVWHVALPGLSNLGQLCYGWRVDGDVSWESGYRVQPEQVLLDPEAPALVHLPTEPAPPLPLPVLELADGKKVLAASAIAGPGLHTEFGGGTEGVSLSLGRPLEGMRVLEVDVKSFAQGPKVSHPGTFLGVAERIDHIRAVGATAVVLTPCYSTCKGLGASHRAAVSIFAPDPALSTDARNPGAAVTELRTMVHALHAAGIEVLLSVDPTFTADGVDAYPAAVSLRGLDHKAYYRPNGVLNCGHPAVQELMLRAMRSWAREFGVDGFYVLNAENLVQDAEGVVQDAPPFAEALCKDPVLSRLKLVAAPSNDALLPRAGGRGFPHWGLWQQSNSAFSRDVVAFIAEGTHAAIDAVAERLSGSASLFDAGWSESNPGNLAVPRRASFGLNAPTPPNGPSLLTLAAESAAAAGAALAASGHPGPAPAASTIAKSLLVAVALAQGVPMIPHEAIADVEMARFMGILMRLRRRLAHLLLPPRFDSPRDISWHGAGGAEPEWVGATIAAGGEPFGGHPTPHGASYLAFSVRHPDGSAVYIGFNPHPLALTAALPAPPAGHSWLVAVDTSLLPPKDAALGDYFEVEGREYLVAGKAAFVLVAAVVEHK